MKNKITLIIPDLHHKWEKAEKIIAAVKHDDIVFLGDYFDDFNDTPDMVQDTADWLVGSVNKPNRVHLFGNHDIQYAFVYRKFQCAGYAQWKYFSIYDTVESKIWDKVKFYHVLDNTWLLTHAGLHKSFMLDSISKLKNDRAAFFKELSEYLDHEIRDGFRYIAEGHIKPCIFGAGHARFGSSPVGGVLWCDYNEEFGPVDGLNQIVGHTPQGKGFAKWQIRNEKGEKRWVHDGQYLPTADEIKNPNISTNVCLDVWKNLHYATWNGNELSVGNFNTLFPVKKT